MSSCSGSWSMTEILQKFDWHPGEGMIGAPYPRGIWDGFREEPGKDKGCYLDIR